MKMRRKRKRKRREGVGKEKREPTFKIKKPLTEVRADLF